MAKNPKPARYPKKLRQKLEKVASERDERAATGDPNARLEAGIPPIFHNFWKDFLPRGSVHAMINRLDDVLERWDVVYHMDAPVTPQRVFLRPPWLRESATR